MVNILMPYFNQLVSKNLSVPVSDLRFWGMALAIILITGLIAGSYPALYLSSFNPVKVLKGTFLAGKAAILPRQVLVVGQFVVSIILISATIIVYQQISHVRNRDIGYTPENLIMIPGSPEATKNFEAIKSSLMQTGMVESISRTTSPITEIFNYSPGPSWSGKQEGSTLVMAALATSGEFSRTMGVKMIAGRDFSGDSPADSSSMILNESAVKAMGLKNPIGTKLNFQGADFTLVGVMSDIVMSSPYKPVDPTMVLYRPNIDGFIHVRLREGVKPQAAVSSMEKTFRNYNPSQPFEYSFVDTDFGKKFVTEELISRITRIFAGLAIFICCLGLAGLASFTIEKRFREIGIRKVLGASINQILLLISTEFLKLVGIAIFIAIPLTWWAMHAWLQQYAYHTSINIVLFLIVGLAMLLLTLIVVSLNSISAAITKPVKSLRSE
jgi:ABC-type antimicrobial peptide transport system permease subunit